MERLLLAGSGGGFGRALLALIVVVAAAGSVPAADRVVFGEHFTNTGCGGDLPYAGQAVDMLLGDYPDDFALVQILVGCSGVTLWGNNRYNFYIVSDTPTVFFDGVEECAGSLAGVGPQYDWYEQRIQTRQASPTDVTIGLSATPVGGPDYRIDAQVCVEAGGAAKWLRFYMVQVLDHWPDTPAYSRNTFRLAADIQDIYLSPGQCETIQRTFPIGAESWARPTDIKIIAWAQERQSTSPPSNRAEVFQAAVLAWPLTDDCNGNGSPDVDDLADCDGSPWCADCNNNTILDWCDIETGTSIDANSNGIPDECEMVGDTNCDGVLNAFDIDPFVKALGDPDSYHALYPDCNINSADCNGDGVLNAFDIDPFVVLLSGR